MDQFSDNRAQDRLPTGRDLEGVGVCLIADNTITHGERFLLEIDALREAGARVVLVTGVSDASARPTGIDFHISPLLQSSPRRFAARIPASTAVWRPWRIAQNLFRNAVRTALHMLAPPQRPTTRPRERLLTQLAREMDVFWVLAYPSLKSTVAVARRTGIRVVYETIDLIPEYHYQGERYRRKCLRSERKSMREVNGMITACDSYADYYGEHYGDISGFRRPIVHDNAPSVSLPAIRPTADRLRVLFLGNIASNRPIRELVEAMALVQSDATVTLQGQNRLGPDLDALVDELRLRGKLRILEPCAVNEVVSIAAEYDVGIAALRGDNENERRASTSKVFTYMSAGLVILGTNLPGIARVVNRHGNGMLVDGMDPRAWAEAMDYLALLPRSDLDQMKQRSLDGSTAYRWDLQKPAFVAEFARVVGRR